MTPTDKFVEAMQEIIGITVWDVKSPIRRVIEAFADTECAERMGPTRHFMSGRHKECRAALLKRVME